MVCLGAKSDACYSLDLDSKILGLGAQGGDK
jgi:hypothetical protein